MTMRPLTYILTAFALVLVVVAAIPSMRQLVRDYFVPDERKIVAKIDGSISPDGPALIIFKVKTRDQYFLEIYKANEKLELMQRIALEEPTEGHFDYQGRFTNLALADINGDGTYEIVSPMYDKNGTPRLLVYQYNSSLQTFEKITGD